jgi:hypothetical protein
MTVARSQGRGFLGPDARPPSSSAFQLLLEFARARGLVGRGKDGGSR